MPLQVKAKFTPRGDMGRFVETHVTPAVRMAVQESAELIEQRAKELCPVDTGALQESITTTLVDGHKTVMAFVGSDLHYAPYVEFGTGIAGASSPGAGKGPYSPTWPGMRAQPYLRPALDESKEPIKQIFANDLQVGLK